MTEYTAAYKQQMFKSQKDVWRFGDQVIINTSDCYAYVEGYIASLFSKAPAVTVGPDATGLGNTGVVEALVNRFLYDEYATLEAGLRYGLLYPCGFYKLGISEKDRAIDSIEIRAVHPWDIIVDMESNKWDTQRFIGHRYYITLDDAKQKWKNKEWTGATKEDYLSNWNQTQVSGNLNNSGTLVSTFNTRKRDGSTMLTFVEIIEFYDMVADTLIFYSPSISTGDNILEEISPIPYRAYDGAPLPPIAPLYFGVDPHIPLKGMSAVSRVYDQLFEINNLRTVWANGLRKDARVYMARKGTIDGEARSQLSSNIDSSVVEIDCPPDQPLGNIIMPVPQASFSPDYSIYKAEVRSDLDRGSILAPFTRGVATNSSATEIAALTQYSASEIGKLARARDTSIESVARIYVSMLDFLIETSESQTPEIIYVEGKAIPLVCKDLKGKFRFAASDQSSTPVSAALKRQKFVEALPVLLSLGVDKQKILEMFIKELDLPPSLAKMGSEQGAQLGKGSAAPSGVEAPAGAPEALPVGGGSVAADVRAGG